MSRAEFKDVPRIDVFSLKGGVGKTTISWLLARAIAKRGAVLIIDADFTGTCLGDYVQFGAEPGWKATPNLAHLVVMPPEQLREQLDGKHLPVYRYDTSTNSASNRLADQNPGANKLLFCPSHVFSTRPTNDSNNNPFPEHSRLPDVEPALLHALVGHETAGGWVGHILSEVARATHEQLEEGLVAWIVDHSPGFSAIQREAMRACTHPLVVSSTDWLDIRMVRDFAQTETNGLRQGSNCATRYLLNRADKDRVEKVGTTSMTVIAQSDDVRNALLHGRAPTEEIAAIVQLANDLLAPRKAA